MSVTASHKPTIQPTGPYDSLRDYVAALDARGRLLRIQAMDQDQYEATAFEDITDDQEQMYRAAMEKVAGLAGDNGEWRRIKPVVVDNAVAPCKEVIVTGESIDIFQYPWLKNNPGDAGRYINSGSVILEDPQLGRNVGTYRCQVKEARKIGVNPEPGQDGWKFLMGMKEQGKRSASAAVVLGVDPITFAMSSIRRKGDRRPGRQSHVLFWKRIVQRLLSW